MRKLLDVMKALTLAIAVLVGASTFVLLLQISVAVKHADAAWNGTLGHLNDAIAQVDRTAQLSGKLVNDARLSVDNINKAAIDQRFYFERELPSLVEQTHGILANLDQATGDLHPLLNETTARTRDLAPIEANAAHLIVGINELVVDPHIKASLSNMDDSTAQLAIASREAASSMRSVRAMAADGEETVHNLTHPKPIVSIANWTLKVVHAIGGWF